MSYDFEQAWRSMSLELQDELLLACCGTHQEWLMVKVKCPPRISGYIGVQIAAPYLPPETVLSREDLISRQQEILARLTNKTLYRRLERAIARNNGEMVTGEEPDIFKPDIFKSDVKEERTHSENQITTDAVTSPKTSARFLSYPLFVIGATALFASVAAFVSSFITLGGWGWILFLWFGFTGMFSLALASQLKDSGRSPFLFALLGCLVLLTAYGAGLWFWISGAVHHVSFWYGLLAPVAFFAALAVYKNLRQGEK